MRAADVRAAGRVAAEGADAVIGLVRDTHRGISGRVFAAIGPAAEPVRVVHDVIAGVVYSSVGEAGRRGPVAAGAVAALVCPKRPDAAAWDETARGSLLLAALNGIYGDELHDQGIGFAGAMGVRVARATVSPEPDALRAAFAGANSRIAVLVHGLCMTEDAWIREDGCYAEGLVAAGFTPVFLRYNTGRHVSANGRDLDALLAELVAAWPVPVEEIVLIGHSMGGLVARSACDVGRDAPWAALVSHVVCLGSPHLGADLEKGVNAATWAMAKLPETRGFARFLNRRSDGIKDLRYGALMDADWADADPDELLSDRCGQAFFLPGVRYHVVSTTAAGPRFVGAVMGDYLVASASASGAGRGGRSIPFPAEDLLEVRGAHHLGLLYHPRVDAALRDWLSS